MNVCYVEYGAKTGKPVLYCHGAPGSRRDILPEMVEVAQRLNIRLIVVERAGYGVAEPNVALSPQDEIRTWAGLMDELEIPHFHVLGFSMGSFYALNCAQVLAERVTGLTLVGSMAPNLFDPTVQSRMMPSVVLISSLARDNPAALETLTAGFLQDPLATLNLVKQASPSVDQLVLANPELAEGFLASLQQGAAGFIRDFLWLTRDWQVSLAQIQQPVTLWCGDLDMNTPLPLSEHLSHQLPNNQLITLPNQGHWCLYSHWSEILTSID